MSESHLTLATSHCPAGSRGHVPDKPKRSVSRCRRCREGRGRVTHPYQDGKDPYISASAAAPIRRASPPSPPDTAANTWRARPSVAAWHKRVNEQSERRPRPTHTSIVYPRTGRAPALEHDSPRRPPRETLPRAREARMRPARRTPMRKSTGEQHHRQIRPDNRKSYASLTSARPTRAPQSGSAAYRCVARRDISHLRATRPPYVSGRGQ